MYKKLIDEDRVAILEDRCLRCNRKLSNSVSMSKQHGKTCWRRILEERAKRNQLKLF